MNYYYYYYFILLNFNGPQFSQYYSFNYTEDKKILSISKALFVKLLRNRLAKKINLSYAF